MEGQLTLCRWCPVSQSSIHMQVITQPNPLHWDLAERWRSAANWLTFTGKSPTCTKIQPQMVKQNFCSGKAEKNSTTNFVSSLVFVYRHRQKTVGGDRGPQRLFSSQGHQSLWIVCCQGVSSDIMEARNRVKLQKICSFSGTLYRWLLPLKAA